MTANYETALARLREHGERLVEDTRGMLRELIRDACGAISAAEGSILVPAGCENELRFLVSVNPMLDRSDLTFPCDGSVSGYVFNSRQAIAKIRPRSDAVDRVGSVSKVETEFLLAVPVSDDESIYGVATFVNREGELGDTPFSAEDMRTAQAFGEIYAVGLRLLRQVSLGAAVARSRPGEDPDSSTEGGSAGEERTAALIAETASSLAPAQRELLLDIAGLLVRRSHELEGEAEDHDF